MVAPSIYYIRTINLTCHNRNLLNLSKVNLQKSSLHKYKVYDYFDRHLFKIKFLFQVVRKPIMRTARNMFIVNLAVSDALVCCVGTPLTLMELLTKHWPLPNWPSLCKACGAIQAISIFVSTITITAIALDRYQVCSICLYKKICRNWIRRAEQRTYWSVWEHAHVQQWTNEG